MAPTDTDTGDQPRDLESLPDFLLIQIFKRLPLADLYNVTLLNLRFQELAVSFRTAFTLNVADFYAPTSGALAATETPDDAAAACRDHYEGLLSNIGRHIQTVRVERTRLAHVRFDETHFFRTAAEHVGPSLRHLYARNCDLSGSWDDVAELLVNLRTLHLDACRSRGGYRDCHVPIVDYRGDTIYDDLDSRRPFGRALLAMRHLRSISLIRCRHVLHVDQMVQLVENNPRLNHVQLHHSSRLGSALLVPTISRVLGATLRTLSLHYNTTHEHDLSALAELSSLRKLQLVNYYQPTGWAMASQPLEQLLRALRGNQTIVELDLHHCRLSEASLEGLATMQALRVLKLRKNYWLTDVGAGELGQHGRLHTIDCYDSLNLTDAGVLRMVLGNAQLEVLDVSWVPQLTGRLLIGLRQVVRDRSVLALAAGRPVRPFRVMLNGRNRVDWKRVREEVVDAEADGGAGAPFGFQVMANTGERMSAGDAAMFRVCYDTMPEDGGDQKDDWSLKYRMPVFEIN